MSCDKPELEPFERAIERLEEGLARYLTDVSNTLIRDALIHRFEIAYTTGNWVLKSYLEYASASPKQFEDMTFQDVIRTANEQGLLLGDWTDWKVFRELRARTARAFDEGVALAVIDHIPRFVQEAAYLRDQLRGRLT